MAASVQRGVPPPPPRSPERVRLAVAIEAHLAAQHQLNHVREAQQREEDRFYNELQPSVAAAKRELVAARSAEPRVLVDQILNGGGLPDDGVDTELRLEETQRELDGAERKLTASREVRKLLADEAIRARAAVSIAEPRLSEAVDAVIRAETSALLPRFVECRKRLAEAAKALLTLPKTLMPDEVRGSHAVSGVVVTVAPHGTLSGRAPAAPLDPAITTWVADLRKDANARLPGLPETDPPDASDAGQKAA